MEIAKPFDRLGRRYNPGDPLPEDLDKTTLDFYKRHGMVRQTADKQPKPSERKPAAPRQTRQPGPNQTKPAGPAHVQAADGLSVPNAADLGQTALIADGHGQGTDGQSSDPAKTEEGGTQADAAAALLPPISPAAGAV